MVILGVVAFVSSCSQDEITAKGYVTFDVNNTNIQVSADGTGSATVNIYSSNNVSGDLMLDVNVVAEGTNIDESNYQLAPTAMIPAGTNKGEFEISFNGLDLSSNPQITLSFGESVNGLTFSEPTTFTVVEECPGTEGFILITFDDYSEETSWEIYQQGSNTPLFSNSYGAGLDGTNESICFTEPGEYLFIIYDAFGDGICCDFGEGSFQLILGDGTLAADGGNFGDSESFEFTVQ
ncbi:hypothetical protein [Psychroflexus salis]|uniref:hypothetical protein n=1 Tax=Psychroflexus salis TaxID=1526574 RepID=UPI00166D0941|nr:hypothetical protein [Psychroflexus salis]